MAVFKTVIAVLVVFLSVSYVLGKIVMIYAREAFESVMQ